MCQYLLVQYMKKQQKYVAVSSSRVHDETSEICQYIVVQYMMKNQKYVLISTFTVHEERTEISSSI